MLKKLRAKVRRHRCDKYMNMLFLEKIRLCDIPESYRLSEDHGPSLHITAFRVDRGISLERYQEDLDFMQLEILLQPDGIMKTWLEYEYQFMQDTFDDMKNKAR